MRSIYNITPPKRSKGRKCGCGQCHLEKRTAKRRDRRQSRADLKRMAADEA